MRLNAARLDVGIHGQWTEIFARLAEKAIDTRLADRNINVIDMLNKSREEIAYNIIDIESEPTEDLVRDVLAIEGVINVSVFE